MKICDSFGNIDYLTPREEEVYKLLLKGFNCYRIAEELCISFATAVTHKSNIFLKGGWNSVNELMANRIAELENEISEMRRQPNVYGNSNNYREATAFTPNKSIG